MATILDILSTFGVLAIITLLVKFVLLMRTRWSFQNKLKDFPEHSRGLFFLGHGKAFLEGAHGMLWTFENIYENNEKAMQFWVHPFQPAVVVYHPDTIKAIFNTAEPKDSSYVLLKPWLGDGLLLSTGRKWARNRRLLTPAFHFDILRPYVNKYVDSTNTLAKKWREVCKNGAYSIEVMQDISLTTLDSLMKCVMGVEEDILQKGTKHPYVNATSVLTKLNVIRFVTLAYQSDVIYALSSDGATNRQAITVAHEFTRRVINERKQQLAQSERDTSKKDRLMPFLDILLKAKDEDGVGLSDQEIRDEVDTFMFEGHDTTASGLSWVVYNLANHPELQERCRKEVDEVMHDRDELEWNDLSKFEYLTQFIKESMRLYPPVPGIGRLLKSPLQLPDGRVIPKGASVYINIYGLHRNPNVWDTPEVFDPERFSKENSVNRHSHAFTPFAAGPRNCIGQQFAMSEMKTVTAVLLRHFRFAPDSSKPVQRINNTVLRSTTGIHVVVETR
ncbi:ultra-long-chain fatty acid omega-hydroxylase-like [Amphiura filiformis]|uniref:ultra-long-chain fatty acid omega-hydroxylase-like n=1 Tax=Amphiura filiformis TaxID=82378 RepID=UPI003B2235D3